MSIWPRTDSAPPDSDGTLPQRAAAPATPTDIRVALHPLPSTPELARAWTELEVRSDASFFLSWTWIGPWLAQMPDGIERQLLVALKGDELVGLAPFLNNPVTSDPVRYARNRAILEEDPTLGIAAPTVAWADAAFSAMHTFRAMHYPSRIRQPILMLAASNDTIVSTPAIEEFAYHLRAGSHLVIAGSKHEILQEQDRYRSQFWAAFDAFVPGTPLFG